MKISFQNQDLVNIDRPNVNADHQGHTAKTATAEKSASVRFDRSNNMTVKPGNLYGGDEKKKNPASITELMQEAGNIDAAVDQNYRTVMSNTMSSEDYAKAREDGFDYYSMDPDEVVTIQDRIKAEVAKGGEVIIGYNDEIADEVLTKALGSETLARSVEDSFEEADLPLTKENIENIKKAWDLAQTLTAPTDAEAAYMVENDLDLDIWGLYLSKNSGNTARYDLSAEKIDLSDVKNAKLLMQVEDILDKAGITGEEERAEGIEKAQWLIDRQLPVNAENINKLNDLEDLSFPVDEKIFSDSVANAVLEGKKPVNAELVSEKAYEESLVSRAVKLEEKVFSEDALSLFKDRRALEEVRLSMTAEVNIKLLGSGFSIDTAPIEVFLEALKDAEKQVAAKYFPEYENDGDKAVEGYRLFNDTNKAVAEIKDDPARTLGMFASRSAEDITVGEFHREGLILRDTYEKAGESYEALMTAPRADLGDNIRKAFSNIGELADEAGVEKTEENLRAIRILGYNRMEINADNVKTVSAADMQVRGLIEKMTPASVLSMIRDGINPLETSFAELNTYFDTQQTNGYEQTAKSYSEFLYSLEMQDNITPEERESYIGIYRLIHQIEKQDGAVVGTVLSEQAVLSFENLLSAVRTRRLHGVDVRVDENFGARTELFRAGADITEQISAAFKAERYVTEAEELREAVNVRGEGPEILENYGIPGSAENLTAIDALLDNEKNLFNEMNKYDRNGRLKKTAEKIREALSSDGFDEAYEEATKELEEMSEEMTLEANSYIDVKAMSLVHRQLYLARRINEVSDPLADRDFIIPMEFGEEISKVRVSFRSDKGDARVSISTALNGEVIDAYFELSENSLEGYIVENGEGTLKNLAGAADILVETLRKDGMLSGKEIKDIAVIGSDPKAMGTVSNSKDNSLGKDAETKNSDGSERRILLQVTKLFLQTLAESRA